MQSLTRTRGWSGFAALVGMVLAMTACAPEYYNDVEAFMSVPRPIVGGKPYVIDPPDTVKIIAPNAPEINNIEQKLRPDGKITLYLLGDIFAAGKTPTQLASEIETRMMQYYEDVTVQVQVIDFSSKVYYMAGETSMGPKSYTGRDTVLDAALRAGIYRTSWPSKAVLLRPSEDPQFIRRMSINLKDLYMKGDLSRNAVLEEGDILFIPLNPLAAVGVVVQNLLSPVQPVIQAASTPAAFTGIPTP